MSLLVVDTDVVSYIFKGHPSAEGFLDILEDNELVISFMTRAELRPGARAANWGPRRMAALEDHLTCYGICYPDEELCDLWVSVMLNAMRTGHSIDGQDAWIAATALQFNAPLVTNNVRHFRPLRGLKVLPSTSP
jgi:predicted nucleic acid-binding protein